MQTNFIHYLNYYAKFCTGYDKYLEKRQKGGITKFNWQFFFFNIFWFVYHRMYIEAFTFLFFIFYLGAFLITQTISDVSWGGLFCMMYFLLTFYSYKLYELHFQRKLDLSAPDPLKKIRPYSFKVSYIIWIVFTLTFIILAGQVYKLMGLIPPTT